MRVSAPCYLQRRTRQILLEQIERSDEEQDVLHQEPEWQGHNWKSARLAGPGIGQEGNNARGTDEGHEDALDEGRCAVPLPGWLLPHILKAINELLRDSAEGAH
jgi:hypothetical protein